MASFHLPLLLCGASVHARAPGPSQGAPKAARGRTPGWTSARGGQGSAAALQHRLGPQTRVRQLRQVPHGPKTFQCLACGLAKASAELGGSKFKSQGYAGVSPRFHLPIFYYGTLSFLSRSQLWQASLHGRVGRNQRKAPALAGRRLRQAEQGTECSSQNRRSFLGQRSYQHLSKHEAG